MKRKVTRKPKAKRPPRPSASQTAKGAKQSPKKAAKTTAKKTTKKTTKTAAGIPAAPQPDGIDAIIRAGTQALRLPLEPAWYGGVKFNLQLIMRLAALVDEFPLPDAAEPGPVFHA
jgi:hypothetical protein